ncbi:MAG: DUF503 domain-containing protein [Candidatus Eisenbacteria bacterium]|nr:DUF503 domain-containing protein [Candidatus Eisenbacteria bacterium]
MVVGSVLVELHIPQSTSLKAKRSVVNRIKQRLASRFNASVAEVDYQDLWQRAAIAVAVVGSEKAVVESSLAKAVNLIQSEPSVEVLAADVTFY